MEVDYLIVGFGIAGMSLAYQLESQGKSVVIIDGHEPKASIVAAGLYNPVILKRFTLAWDVENQMQYALHFYKDLGHFLKINTTEDLPIFRKFNNAEEQNNWFRSIDKPQLSKYLSPYLKESPTEGVRGAFKFGEVKHTGRVLIRKIFEAYKSKLILQDKFLQSEFNFEELRLTDTVVTYNSIKANRIVFCEGHKLKQNPYFNNLPLIGSKGSYLIIKSPNLKLNAALKSYYYVIPLGNDLYKFGATYGHQFTENHDMEAKKELISRLETLVDVPYEIVDFIVGVRPTVKDRRPLLGKHPEHKQVFVMNGMGTRGVLLAPITSFYLKEFIEEGKPLPDEMDIKRFI